MRTARAMNPQHETVARPAGKPRIFAVDVLRGIAIALVVYLHLGLYGFVAPVVVSNVLNAQLAGNGYYGVSIFFVVSGFLITRYVIARDGELGSVILREFYVLRFSRIAPGFLLLICVNFVLFAINAPGFRWDTTLHPLGPFLFDLFTFRANIYRVEHGGFSYPWDVLWSLAVEEVFYLFYPLLCRSLRRPAFIVAALVVIALIGPLYRAFSSDHFYGYFACFDLLALGCLVGILERHFHDRMMPSTYARALQIVGATSLCATYLLTSVQVDYVKGPTLIGLAAALFIAGSAMQAGSATVASSRPSFLLRFGSHLGSLSYEVYLFHIVLLALLAGAYQAFFTRLGIGGLANAYDVGCLAFILLLTAFGTYLGRFVLDPARRQIRRTLLELKRQE